ncbi:MAG: branched-chain amino acid ABC transporter permease, partial [Alicyclobacillus sp.]|nr:branched-chain amino acid ABC transporter permease [Alicyclobacillus sp.]
MSRFKSWGIPVLVLALLVVVTLAADVYYKQIFFYIFLFAGVGFAWNLVGGYAGQLSLGHAAFFGMGAYTYA